MDADDDVQIRLDEWQLDTIHDLIIKLPAMGEVIKKHLPNLEIDWEHIDECKRSLSST